MKGTMKAVEIQQYGSNDVVEIHEVDRPQPGTGELLIRVRAAGVNPIDWKIRNGAGERMGMTLPIRLGGELVGTVEQVGDGVLDFAHGDNVFGMVKTGAFAEYALVKAADMVTPPSHLDFVHAAALPLAGSTAWQALFDEGGLAPGQRLLITNSSGGVGSLAVQFAKAKGAYVIAVASARNQEFVRSLGADEFIDHTSLPFEQAANNIDVVFDTVGGDSFERALSTLKKGGCMVTVVSFPKDEAHRYQVTVKRSITIPSARNLSAITELVNAGKVRSNVEKVIALQDIKQALSLSEAGRARGKIVLAIGD